MQSPTLAERRPTLSRTGIDHFLIPSARDSSAVSRFTDNVLRRLAGADAIVRAAEEAPDHGPTLICLAAYYLLADTASGILFAAATLNRIHERALRLAPSDRLFAAALRAIAYGEKQRASRLFLDLAYEYPHHLLASYVGHLHFLNEGHFSVMREHAQRLVTALPRNPFTLGMAAFALEETGDDSAAVDYASAAYALDPSIAWVHHAYAHLFKNQGRAAEGAVWLQSRSAQWEPCSSSMRTHNWWHVQLLLLEAQEIPGVLRIYDHKMAGESNKSVGGFVNAVALLARLELRGIDVGSRWNRLADKAERSLDEHALPFIDLHYALALSYGRRGRALNELHHNMVEHVRRLTGAAVGPWIKVGLPFVNALKAMTGDSWAEATRYLDGSMPYMTLIGGSAQQRELFQEIEASLKKRASLCHRPAYWSQDVIGIIEPLDDRRAAASA